MRYRYPSEFRREVPDLLAVGGSVASIVADFGPSDQTIYNWRRRDLAFLSCCVWNAARLVNLEPLPRRFVQTPTR